MEYDAKAGDLGTAIGTFDRVDARHLHGHRKHHTNARHSPCSGPQRG
jgi:hypothetical protein